VGLPEGLEAEIIAGFALFPWGCSLILDLPVEFEFSSAARLALAPRLKYPPRRLNGVVVGFTPYPFDIWGITPRQTIRRPHSLILSMSEIAM